MPFSREIAYHRACPSDTLHLEAASIRIGCKLYHYSRYVAAIILLQVPGRGHAPAREISLLRAAGDARPLRAQIETSRILSGV
jgi:hypothetical protein